MVKTEFVGKEDTPKWMHANRYIIKGYKKNFNTIKDNIKSMFMAHNETLNIWSHLLGSILFFFILLYVVIWVKRHTPQFHVPNLNEVENFITSNYSYLKDNYYNDLRITEVLNNIKKNIIIEENKLVDGFEAKYENIKNNLIEFKNHFFFIFFNLGSKINNLEILSYDLDILKPKNLKKLNSFTIYLFIISAMLCLGFSTIYHLFGNINKKVSTLLKRFDYAGISILIFGSTAPIYYISFCNKNLFHFYLTISFLACFIVFLLFFFDKFHEDEYRKVKMVIYLGLILVICIPIFHIIINLTFFTNQYSIPFFSGYELLILSGAFYILGLNIYIFAIPERFSPGTFDIWFSSHFIWHILVILGALTHFFSVIKLFNMREKLGCFN